MSRYCSVDPGQSDNIKSVERKNVKTYKTFRVISVQKRFKSTVTFKFINL